MKLDEKDVYRVCCELRSDYKDTLQHHRWSGQRLEQVGNEKGTS